jgi:isovaleryl-CoA dehydrogenase
VTGFIVHPKEYPGWNATPIDTVGLSKSFRTCVVHLDDSVVPVEDRLGDEGEGFTIVHAGPAAGAGEGGGQGSRGGPSLLRGRGGLRQRSGPSGSANRAVPDIQSEIAEMAVAIEASRALVYKAAVMMDNSLPSNRMAALAKYHASQTAKLCADKAMQIFGGYGLAAEYRVARYRCYADLFFTGEGTANVQKIMIAEDAVAYKPADRHHGKTGLRDIRTDDVATEARSGD